MRALQRQREFTDLIFDIKLSFVPVLSFIWPKEAQKNPAIEVQAQAKPQFRNDLIKEPCPRRPHTTSAPDLKDTLLDLLHIFGAFMWGDTEV